MAERNLLLGRLRRDTMVLGTSENTDDLMKQGEDAVKQGRAAEVWIIPVVGYFSEADQNWGGIDRYQGGTFDTAPSSVPPLNPGAGPQEPEGTSDKETVSIAGNIEAERQAQVESGTLVDAGPADRLAEAGRSGSASVPAGGNEALAQAAREPSPATKDKGPNADGTPAETKPKTDSFDDKSSTK